jgi:hypothetical protein
MQVCFNEFAKPVGKGIIIFRNCRSHTIPGKINIQAEFAWKKIYTRLNKHKILPVGQGDLVCGKLIDNS